MDHAAAVTRVSLLGAVDRRPVVDQATVESLVDSHPIPDVTGIGVDQQGWTATYDVMAATAEVWRIKAGLVAGDYNFTADDASFSKGDVLAHCLEMEAKYAAMAGSKTGLGTSTSGTILVGSTVFGYNPTTYIDQATWAEQVLP